MKKNFLSISTLVVLLVPLACNSKKEEAIGKLDQHKAVKSCCMKIPARFGPMTAKADTVSVAKEPDSQD